MPTGYTAGVGEGKVTDFREYALMCARNFGALILMRDDPFDAEIPRSLKASQYNNERLDEAKIELDELRSMSEQDLQLASSGSFFLDAKEYNRAIEEKRVTKERYEAMLEKARLYDPPTDDHVGFAEFLVSQLEESIKWDCSTDYYKVPEKLSGADWMGESEARLLKDIHYHANAQREENERTASRNKWIAGLFESLDA